MTAVAPVTDRQVYFVESLPYFRIYRTLMAHADLCSVCHNTVYRPEGPGEEEDLCRAGRELNQVLTHKAEHTRAVSAWN